MPHDLYAAYVDGCAAWSARSAGARWGGRSRRGPGSARTTSSSTGSPTSPCRRPRTPRSGRRWRRRSPLARRDVEAAVAASVPVIVSPLSHCYLDVPYAEPSADPAQADRQRPPRPAGLCAQDRRRLVRLGARRALGPGRAAQVAGVEAAIWAETISGFDDLSFLLLPRLAGVAHKAWSGPQAATWAGHRDRLARHGRAVGPGRPHLLPRLHRGLGLNRARPRAEVEQFLVEAADLPVEVDQVDLEDPVAGPARSGPCGASARRCPARCRTRCRRRRSSRAGTPPPGGRRGCRRTSSRPPSASPLMCAYSCSPVMSWCASKNCAARAERHRQRRPRAGA